MSVVTGIKDISLQIHRGEVLGHWRSGGRWPHRIFGAGVRNECQRPLENSISKEKRSIRNLRGMPSILELDWFRRIEKRKAHFCGLSIKENINMPIYPQNLPKEGDD